MCGLLCIIKEGRVLCAWGFWKGRGKGINSRKNVEFSSAFLPIFLLFFPLMRTVK
jgi:hypothetical protein